MKSSLAILLLTAAQVVGNSFTCGLKTVSAQEALEQKLVSRMQEMHCPGALVGIFPGAGAPTKFALGTTQVDGTHPMTLDMHMCVGSVMKPFIGTVALQLVDENKLSLDDPISKYVDDVPAGEKITIRMLGNNTSGIFNSIENKAFQKAIMEQPDRVWEPEEIFEYAFSQPAYFEPGEKWRYSNSNAVLLGLCIEKVTGQTYQEQISERIFKPLKLTESGFVGTSGLAEPHPSAYRHGYPDKVIGYGEVFYDVSNYSPAWTGAAGNMYSTLGDLGRSAKPIMTGELLSAASKQELHRWREIGHGDYQYGFAMGKHGSGIGHPGDVPGYNASFLYFPTKDVGIVVMTNLSNNSDGTMPAEELAKIVQEELSL